jgi:nitroreductase
VGTFDDVVAAQRACRQYTDEPVGDATIEALVAAACRAPSAENRQPWRFVVVRDPGTRATLGELMRQLWDQGGRRYTEGRVPAGLLHDVDRGFHGGLESAPVMLVIGGDATVTNRSTLPSSVFPAVQNLLLAATSRGLGTCLTTIATARADEVRALVGFPPDVDPLAIVPVGHPARALGPSRREPASSKLFRERYDTPWT